MISKEYTIFQVLQDKLKQKFLPEDNYTNLALNAMGCQYCMNLLANIQCTVKPV
jgi:hypothetical protein